MSKLGDTPINTVAGQDTKNPSMTIRQLACLMLAQGLLASTMICSSDKLSEEAILYADEVLKVEKETRDK